MKRIELPDGLPSTVILLSHRAPVTFSRDDDGKLTAKRGAGGLVTALSDLESQLDDVRWVCAASGGDDLAAAQEGEAGDLRFVDVPDDQHERFYGQFSNPILWFIQHGLYGVWSAPDLGDADHAAFHDGYVPVNEAF